jgi:hypothetical protein
MAQFLAVTIGDVRFTYRLEQGLNELRCDCVRHQQLMLIWYYEPFIFAPDLCNRLSKGDHPPVHN